MSSVWTGTRREELCPQFNYHLLSREDLLSRVTKNPKPHISAWALHPPPLRPNLAFTFLAGRDCSCCCCLFVFCDSKQNIWVWVEVSTVVIACFTLSKGTLTHPAEPHETCQYRISRLLDEGAAMAVVASNHLHLHCDWYLVFTQAALAFYIVLWIHQWGRSTTAAVGQKNAGWRKAAQPKKCQLASVHKLLNCNSRRGWGFEGTQLCAHVSDYFQPQWQHSKLTGFCRAYAPQTTKHITTHQSTDAATAPPWRN